MFNSVVSAGTKDE